MTWTLQTMVEWFLDEPLRLLLALAIALLLVQTLRLYVSRHRAAWRVAEHRRLGDDGERLARKLLAKEGYKILEEQTSGSYPILIDGNAVVIHLRADFLVSKASKRFIAEVKSGEESAKVTGRATRRQLLEYSIAFSVDGILLVDVSGESIRSVEFPKRSAASRAKTT